MSGQVNPPDDLNWFTVHSLWPNDQAFYTLHTLCCDCFYSNADNIVAVPLQASAALMDT